jgi:hypothetical protein
MDHYHPSRKKDSGVQNNRVPCRIFEIRIMNNIVAIVGDQT